VAAVEAFSQEPRPLPFIRHTQEGRWVDMARFRRLESPQPTQSSHFASLPLDPDQACSKGPADAQTAPCAPAMAGARTPTTCSISAEELEGLPGLVLYEPPEPHPTGVGRRVRTDLQQTGMARAAPARYGSAASGLLGAAEVDVAERPRCAGLSRGRPCAQMWLAACRWPALRP